MLGLFYGAPSVEERQGVPELFSKHVQEFDRYYVWKGDFNQVKFPLDKS